MESHFIVTSSCEVCLCFVVDWQLQCDVDCGGQEVELVLLPVSAEVGGGFLDASCSSKCHDIKAKSR